MMQGVKAHTITYLPRWYAYDYSKKTVWVHRESAEVSGWVRGCVVATPDAPDKPIDTFTTMIRRKARSYHAAALPLVDARWHKIVRFKHAA